MNEGRAKRKLSAILSADVKGYRDSNEDLLANHKSCALLAKMLESDCGLTLVKTALKS